MAVMLGLFIGVAPIWGFQIMAVIFFTMLLKLNKVIALAAAHISIPPMIPLILFASFKVGGWILGRSGGLEMIEYRDDLTFAHVKADLSQYIIGSLALGVILAVVTGVVLFIVLRMFRKDPVLAEGDHHSGIKKEYSTP